jgi:SAM-dependent methyltransferase
VSTLIQNIYQNARHYDLLMPGPHDLPFYQRQVARWGEPVLELGCGTGRLSVALAAARIDVTGLDIEATMLEEAHHKARNLGAAIELVHADCRDFSLDRQFRLVFFANNSLAHLLTRSEVERCLHCVRRHLAPEGRLVLDLFMPSLRVLTRDPAQSFPVGRYDDPGGDGLVTVTETNRYDAATQVNHITWHYQWENKSDIVHVPLDLRMFYPEEIDALLTYNGFFIDQRFGDYEENPFRSDSPKQLIVCR